jgi:hypothetical protein
MTRSPHRSQSSGKGGASGESEKPTEGEEMARFKDLAKRLVGISNKQLREAQAQHAKEKADARKRKT